MNSHALLWALCAAALAAPAPASAAERVRPNFIVIYADDLRADGLSGLGGQVATPHLDRLLARSLNFKHAVVVSALCTPSRAQLLTGRYSSQNGVADLPAEKPGDTSLRRTRFNPGEPLVAELLRTAGYVTGAVGKWHIDNSPASCGFDFARTVYGNGDYYDQTFTDEHGRIHPTSGHVEDANAAFGQAFLAHARAEQRPFFLFYNTRAPHMDSRYAWPSDPETRERLPAEGFRLPETLDGSLAGKPPYLERSRLRTQAIHYGYLESDRVRQHQQEYHAAIAELDAKIQPLLEAVEREGLSDSTYIIFMGDNGWFLGEHLFTSKVLAYEESMRVPLFIAGPGISAGASAELASNLDIAPTLLELAAQPVPAKVYGRSLRTVLLGGRGSALRDAVLYEMAPAPDTGRNPFIRALRSASLKLIRTYRMGSESEVEFVELYDLELDPHERSNVADDPAYAGRLQALSERMDREIEAIARHR
jgi:arylsulfatase A-like enzyme